MRHFFLLLLLALVANIHAQTVPEPTTPSVAIVTVTGFTGSGGTYSGTLTNWRDIYETDYIGTACQVGDKFIDGVGKVYEITSVTSSSFNSASVVISCLSDPVGAPIGTGQVFRPLDNGLYPVAPDGNTQIGQFLQGLILSHNAALSDSGSAAAAAAGYRDTTLTASGITFNVTFTGDAPALSGSAGSYTLTFPDGSNWRSALATASSAAAATSGNDLDIVVVDENGVQHRPALTITDLGTDQVINSPKLEYGILLGQSVSGGNTITTSFTGIGGLTGFVISLVK